MAERWGSIVRAYLHILTLTLFSLKSRFSHSLGVPSPIFSRFESERQLRLSSLCPALWLPPTSVSLLVPRERVIFTCAVLRPHL
jgi:hypothetical protein